MVNNAGIGAFGDVLEQAPEDWDRVIETHLNACFLLSKVVVTSMVKQRRGKIINIASLYAVFGAAFVSSYSAAKGAVVQLTKSMAIELAPFNIKVNALAPGFIETDLTESMKTTPVYREVIARTPAGRGLIPTNAPARPCFWRPVLRILSPGQPSSWMVVTPSGEPHEAKPVAPR